MAVAVATAVPSGTDVVHEVRFIVRNAGATIGSGASPQSQANVANLLDALEDAIVAGTITLTGLELWRRS